MEQEPTSRLDPLGVVGMLLLVAIVAIIGGAFVSACRPSIATVDSPSTEIDGLQSVVSTDALAQVDGQSVPGPQIASPGEGSVQASAGPDAPTTELATLPAEALAPPASPTPPPTATFAPTLESAMAAPSATEDAIGSPQLTAAASFAEAPLPTPPGVYSWTLKVPILMYHYLSTPPEGADIYRVDLSVSPESFREQLRYLKENGYSTIDFYDLSRAITNYQELPEKSVILTFDDGYIDNYENAFPLLKEFGYTATFFIVTDFVDEGRAEYMTWPMIEEMAAAGMRMESHSRNHPDLRTLSRDGLIWEMLGSQETLAAHIGYTPRYFAYPGGTYNEASIEVLNELQFWGAVTTKGGTWHGFDDRFEWSRVRIRYTTTPAEFAGLVDLQGTSRGKLVE